MTWTRTRSAVWAVMLVAACLGPLGCAVKAQRLPQIFSDDARAQLKVVGIPAARTVPRVSLKSTTSGKGWGALKGAGYGFVAGASPGLSIPGGVGGCGGIALVCAGVLVVTLAAAAAGGTVGALGGTVYGAVAADSAASLYAAQAELESAVAELEVQRTLRDHVLSMAGSPGALRLVAIDDDEPGAVTGLRDYPGLARQGIDSVLEIEVTDFHFADARGIKPPRELIMTASVKLVRTADGAELFADQFFYRGAAAYKPLEWAAERGQAFREEVDRATRLMADDIVRVLFRIDATAPADERVE
jgi:hypothetical protein